MGNCFGTSRQNGGLVVDASRFSFSRRLEPWEKTGMVAFRNSDLSEFPRQVEAIAKKVRVLDGSNNKIREVPPYVQLMVSCNRLGLSRNRISSLPSGISALVNLRVLLLDNNRFREVPRSILALPKLERLNLACNGLMELPRGISGLKALKSLDVSNNKLMALPRELGELSHLEELHASSNDLDRLPVDLAKLEKLRLIVAENNRIDAVPSEIMLYCEALRTMALHGNPLTIEKLQAAKGYKEFEARRKAKWDKSITAGVLLGASKFDEGVDRARVRHAVSPRAEGATGDDVGIGNIGSGASEETKEKRRKYKDKERRHTSSSKKSDVRAHEISTSPSASH